jgi:peroxiredoxin
MVLRSRRRGADGPKGTPVLRPCSLGIAGALFLVGCVHRPVASVVPPDPLVGSAGQTFDARELAAGSRLTALVFFASDCPCFARHGDRLRALYDAYHARGLQLVVVDPEVRATPERDAAIAAERGYPFPILVDRGGKLAGALGAEYATYSVVLDAAGNVRYRGGIDSDKNHLHDDAAPYLRDAVDDLLAGRAPRRATAKTLGCALETW